MSSITFLTQAAGEPDAALRKTLRNNNLANVVAPEHPAMTVPLGSMTRLTAHCRETHRRPRYAQQ
eukprot:9070276-Pyramimonas_sp.AAC.1